MQLNSFNTHAPTHYDIREASFDSAVIDVLGNLFNDMIAIASIDVCIIGSTGMKNNRSCLILTGYKAILPLIGSSNKPCFTYFYTFCTKSFTTAI